jgi:membrane protein
MQLSLLWQLLRQTAVTWLDSKSSRLGAALAFYSVLSVAPLLGLTLEGASAIWGKQAAQGQIVGQVRGIVGDQGASAIQSILAAASGNEHGGLVAALVGTFSLLFSASGAFGELQDSMNQIWHVPAAQGKPWLILFRERFFSFAMVAVTGFLLLISLLVSAGLAAATKYIDDLMPFAIFVMGAVNTVTSFVVVSALFALIFKSVPDLAIPWRGVWPGALLTALLFVVGKSLIGLYLGRAGVASSYGAAGSIVVLLLWIYYSAQILFFGAEFTYIYSSHFRLHETPLSPERGVTVH